MVFTVSRSDITALKFEIPLIDESGNSIFGASYSNSFFNLNDGDEYPCGNNQAGTAITGRQKCYIFFGDQLSLGTPVQIIMTDFNYGTFINARLLIKNPTSIGLWLSLTVKAYTGTQD